MTGPSAGATACHQSVHKPPLRRAPAQRFAAPTFAYEGDAVDQGILAVPVHRRDYGNASGGGYQSLELKVLHIAPSFQRC